MDKYLKDYNDFIEAELMATDITNLFQTYYSFFYKPRIIIYSNKFNRVGMSFCISRTRGVIGTKNFKFYWINGRWLLRINRLLVYGIGKKVGIKTESFLIWKRNKFCS